MEEIVTAGLEVSMKESGSGMDLSKEGEKSHAKREVCEKGTLTALWVKKSKAVVDLVSGEDDGNGMVVDAPELKRDGNPDVVLDGNEADKQEETSPGKIEDQEGEKEGESGLKKRKRLSLPGEVVSVLEAWFAKNAYPSAQEKKEMADKYAVEVKKVTNWFERRRKKARAEGALSDKKPLSEKKECNVMTENDNVAPIINEREETAENQNKDVEMETPADAVEILDGLLAKHEAFSGMSHATLADEAVQLRERGLLQPLQDLSRLSDGSLEFSESTLCKLVAGQRATLTALVDTLHPVFCGENKPGKDALRTCIVDLAARKSYDFVNSSVPKHLSLEMENPELKGKGLWQWEIRDRETLPRSCRTQATAIKKRGMKIGERLKIITSLLDPEFGKKSTEEVTNVLTSLLKTSSLSELDAHLEAEQAASQNKIEKEHLKVEREAERIRKQKEKELEKEKLKEMKLLQQKLREEEKAKAAEEKEAERQRIKAEKEEEKKRLKAEKEAEREKKMIEARENKLCKKTGFKDAKVLHKTADKFKSFFQKTDSVKEKTPAKAASSGQEKALSPFDRRFPKPPMENLSCRRGPLKCLSLDQSLNESLPFDHVLEEWKISLQEAQTEMKRVKEECARKYLGLPPSWARKPNALEAAEERMEELKGSGIKAEDVRTWRRKFIWFPADSKRPPYYGSWSVQSSHVTARNPLAQDQSMDYEVMSDIDWEEEPEGSSLSRGDSLSEIGNESVDEEDSFFVEDGYLSQDEGVQLDEEEDEELEKAIDAIHIPESPNESNSSSRTACRSALAAILDKSKRSGKPFVLSRTGVSAEANHGACFHGDSNLVPALEMELLLPGGLFEIPKDPYEVQNGDVPTKEQTVEDALDVAKHAATVTKGSHADLLPVLSSYILNNASLTKPVLIEGFLSENSGRKITKKWVNESISLLANRSGSKWVLKSKEDVLDKTPSTKTPACTLKAPKSSEIIEKQNKPLFFAKTPVRNSIDLTGTDTPARIASSVDSKFWQNLVEEIESDVLEPNKVPFCTQAFSRQFLSRHIASFPSSVLAVLISNLVHRMGSTTGNQRGDPAVGMLLNWLSAMVSILSTTSTSSGPNAISRSQTPCEPIAKPVVATLADVAHHQTLICKLCHLSTMGEEKAFDILSNLISNRDSGAYLKSQSNTARALDALLSNAQNTLSKTSAWPTAQATWNSISQES